MPGRARLAAFVGGGLASLSRAFGRGSGSVVGGHVILAIEPQALRVFSAGRHVVLVSGTNGKTTTTKLLASALGAASGREVVTNVTGANLPTGLASSLAAARGRPSADAVLEVDEAWLARVSAQARPAALVLLNLSRDQLDRNNEVRHVAQRWRQACSELPTGAAVVANADDPLVAWAASAAGNVTWVGAGLGWKNDATGCPSCAGPVNFDEGQDEAGRGGHWRCAQCGLARPQLDVPSRDLQISLPGRCNQANALMALATLLALGYSGEPVERASAALATVCEVAGRYAVRGTVEGREIRMLLAKNPAGWAEVFDMLSPPPTPVVIAINARTADGHDPSWLWDVPFERLAGRRVVATGDRNLDLAVRLHYAGVDHDVEPDLVRAVEVKNERADVVANYTAFHQLLARLPKRPET